MMGLEASIQNKEQGILQIYNLKSNCCHTLIHNSKHVSALTFVGLSTSFPFAVIRGTGEEIKEKTSDHNNEGSINMLTELQV